MTDKPVIFVVDDSPGDLALVEAALQDSKIDCVIRTARGAEEASAYLTGGTPYEDRMKHPMPSLILLDLQLHGKSGLDFLRWLREQPPDWRRTPVIMLTTSHDLVEVRAAYDAGANSFLVKTTGFEELAHMMAETAAYWLKRNRYA